MHDATYPHDGRIDEEAHSDDAGRWTPRGRLGNDGAVVAHVERHDDAPDECTLYPDDATGHELMTTWITAADGSYVDLSEMR